MSRHSPAVKLISFNEILGFFSIWHEQTGRGRRDVALWLGLQQHQHHRLRAPGGGNNLQDMHACMRVGAVGVITELSPKASVSVCVVFKADERLIGGLRDV
jgi:hypothetical protein